ncbi:hypothetical protein EDE15_4646 [Edaphobacter aggregans]|uniref:Uncharacterized protein n=1 Tax=Edaphobacter aggregans TaxID=570835 RepID=A0A428MQN7_9BACT|nr:hypothetical protein EDE15_4646 [Edaphobacter aggregans]
MARPLTKLLVVATLFVSLLAGAQQASHPTQLEFHSSSSSLDEIFRWARGQALAYVAPSSSSIGPWYEAALPGRNAFCMRDVSHQTEGATVLGLAAANRNMLGRFAASVDEKRDWAGYWEIDGEGRPSSADYVSDADFWFNLPANFDMLDAIVRMWRWTGDDTYRDDPRFREFFRRTVNDYVTRWQLQPEKILHRPRIANQRLESGKFVHSRGIPSYSEGPKDFIFGADLLAAEYRGLRSFQEIAVTPQDKALAVSAQSVADQIQQLLERIAWSQSQQHYLGVIRHDQSGFESGDAMTLYFGAAKNPDHLRGALDYISSPKYWQKINIEEESYTPLLLFRYGRTGPAYHILFDLSGREKPRREYPEVSYAVIAALVGGTMGVAPSRFSEPFDVQTLAQLPSAGDNASLLSLPFRKNLLDIKHTGSLSSSLSNRSGPALRWRAVFQGTVRQLKVNGKAVLASHDTLPGGMAVSWIAVTVPARATAIVSSMDK